MTKKIIFFALLLTAALFSFTSCEEEPEPTGTISGTWVVNTTAAEATPVLPEFVVELSFVGEAEAEGINFEAYSGSAEVDSVEYYISAIYAPQSDEAYITLSVGEEAEGDMIVLSGTLSGGDIEGNYSGVIDAVNLDGTFTASR